MKDKYQIPLKDLAQWHHIQFLISLEKTGAKAFKVISKSLIKELLKDLSSNNKLHKSQKYPGWTQDAAPIQQDLSKIMDASINKHLLGLKWLLLGGDKTETKNAKELGLGKFTPGMLVSAYLHSLDSQRQHFIDLFGKAPPDLPPALLKETVEYITEKFLRFTDLYLHQLKVDLVTMIENVGESGRLDLLSEANKELIDDGESDVFTDSSSTMEKTEVKTDIGKLLKNHADKWDRVVSTNLGTSSAIATHQAMLEIHGHDNANIKCANIDMQDSRVCQFCNFISKTATGRWKLYKLNDLKPSGYNFNRKRPEWKASLAPQHPRCYSYDTAVMTNEGWKEWPNVTGNELFLSVDPVTENAEWVKAKQLIKYQYNGKMEHFTNNNADFLVTPNHTHVVRRKLSGQKPVDRSIKLVDGERLPATSVSFIGAIPKWQGLNPELIVIGSCTFQTDLFVKFLAIFLSEGSFTYNKGRDRWEMRISQVKYKQEFDNIIKQLFPNPWIGKEATYIKIEDTDLIDYFKQFGKSWQKFIPESIKNLSTELLSVFLDYYILGDGTIAKNRPLKGGKKTTYSRKIFTSSSKMVSDISEIVLKVNKRPSISFQKARVCQHKNGPYLTKHPGWVISICESPNYSRNTMVKTLVDYDNMVYDVELEKFHTLITKRNGRVIVSGNCRCQTVYVPPGFKLDEFGGLIKK